MSAAFAMHGAMGECSKMPFLGGCDVLKSTRRDMAMQKAVRHWISGRAEQLFALVRHIGLEASDSDETALRNESRLRSLPEPYPLLSRGARSTSPSARRSRPLFPASIQFSRRSTP